jgi:hypothetical protein
VQEVEQALQDKIRLATRQAIPYLLSDVTDFFVRSREKLDAVGKEVTGEIASEELATSFADLLATPGEGAPKGLSRSSLWQGYDP